MKTIIPKLVVVAALLALSILNSKFSIVFGQNTSMTYQGRVLDNAASFSGSGEFKFALVTSTNFNQTAVATANAPSGGFITIINVISGGNGYTAAPVVTISGGGGTGAAANATITGGVVTAITVNNPGSGYTTTPTVIVAPPPANVSYTTYWSNDGTSANGSEPASAVIVPVNNGLFTVVLGDASQPNMTAIATSIFEQPNLQLRIWFNDGVLGFAALSPLQNLTAAPYAVTAANATALIGKLPATQLSGTIPANQLGGTLTLAQLPGGLVTNNQTSVTLNGTFAGDGGGLVNIRGALPWQLVLGKVRVAQPNTGYLLLNSALSTVTLPASPNTGDVVRISCASGNGWKMAQNSGQSILLQNIPGSTNIAISTPQAGAPSTNWYAIASSADGTKLVAVVLGGQIYTSTDSGVTWSARAGNAGSQEWTSVASSADGAQLVAVSAPDIDGGGGLIYSSDSGATWNAQPGSPVDTFTGVASSMEGAYIVAAAIAADEIHLYVSRNYGGTWSPATKFSVTNPQFISVASSSNGSNLVAAAFGGQIYVSVDAGTGWTPRDSVRNWTSVASSADGGVMAATCAGGFIYTSVDLGQTWQPQPGSGVNGWNSITSSANGTNLAATVYGGQVYLSSDAGVTWAAPPGMPTNNWNEIASSADGTKLAEVVAGGLIYTTTFVPSSTPGPSGYLSGSQNSAIELQYIGNGVFLPLSHEGTIAGH